MSTPKKFPPYRVEGEGLDSFIIDATGALVVNSVMLSMHYADAFPDGEIMKVLCDAMNGVGLIGSNRERRPPSPDVRQCGEVTISRNGYIEKLERERDAAFKIIEQIEERFIDGCNTYEDWKFMGETARNFLYPENSDTDTPSGRKANDQ